MAESVTIPVDDVQLEGLLKHPTDADGLVVFAHGSGSSRHSPRNQFVAETLREANVGTLLFDLLTESEDRDRANRFDIDLLTDRLVGVTEWLRSTRGVTGPTGYFGSSTGAAAALRAAARRPGDTDAVVSRGGRVDLAQDAIPAVRASTLLIVGGDDPQVLEHNEAALDDFVAEATLHVVDGAGHLFEGPGELEEVAEVATDWCASHLR